MHPPNPQLVADLESALTAQHVLSRPIDRLGRSADASIYRLVPEVVCRPRNVEDVRALLACARRHRRHITFRAGGTSLSGQAVTDGILVELAHTFNACHILDDGRRIRSQPGVTGGRLNRLLAPFGTRIGPDPASVDAAMLGGIVANNSSGMCCGVAQNTYRTLDSLIVVLADGSVIDTSRDGQALPRPIREGLLALRDRVRADGTLVDRIRTKFSRKNTTGYSLNAFVDYDDPVDILAHLMVGSEGTLGFVAEATLRTVPELPLRATALLLFDDLRQAGAAVPPLAEAGAVAIEIMDAACLRSQSGAGRPAAVGPDAAALLTEMTAANQEELAAAVIRAQRALAPFHLAAEPHFSADPHARAEHWRLRKNLLPAVGARRSPGTSVVIEDVVVPVDRLADAVHDLQGLFQRHALSDAAVFGHAKDGNLHFLLAQDFSRSEEVERYAALMEDLVELVVATYDGALKAEHGAGRNMAPFVRREWGDAAYDCMRRVKQLLDPEGLLNPGVLLSDDPRAHLRHLKPLPGLGSDADLCIECGFCEPRCPSRDLTLSPRQRIVVNREVHRLGAEGTPEALRTRAALLHDYPYQGARTCAGDGLCATSCPVGIDTGTLVRKGRAEARSVVSRGLAWAAANGFGLLATAARTALGFAALARRVPGGMGLLAFKSRMLNGLLPSLVPVVDRHTLLPGPAPPLHRPDNQAEGRRLVYFPSCLSRILGPLPGESQAPLPELMNDVLRAAGFAPTYPRRVGSLCCGLPFDSKGWPNAAAAAAQRTLHALTRASSDGRVTVVTDASPCSQALANHARDAGLDLTVVDFPTFWADEVLPRLGDVPRRPGTAILHPTCSTRRSGELPQLLQVARAHAEDVVVPAAAECCGFAGDKGWLVPELSAAATALEAAEVRERLASATGHYSTSRTCEIGLTRAVGRPYRSLVQLVHDALFGANDQHQPAKPAP